VPRLAVSAPVIVVADASAAPTHAASSQAASRFCAYRPFVRLADGADAPAVWHVGAALCRLLGAVDEDAAPDDDDDDDGDDGVLFEASHARLAGPLLGVVAPQLRALNAALSPELRALLQPDAADAAARDPSAATVARVFDVVGRSPALFAVPPCHASWL
jgi:hypothetical protein